MDEEVLPESVTETDCGVVSFRLNKTSAVPSGLVAAYARTSAVSPETVAVNTDSPLIATLLKSWTARAVGDRVPRGPAPEQAASADPSEKTL